MWRKADSKLLSDARSCCLSFLPYHAYAQDTVLLLINRPTDSEEDLQPFYLHLIIISLKPCYKMLYLGSRTFLRVISLRPGALMTKVQHTAVLQLMYDFAYVKGLLQLTGRPASFILVFIFGAALRS